jgi:hypothetical protein
MATFSKVKLSGSTDGRMVKVAATATLGTTIHTAHATSLDEIHLWAVNSDTTARKLTIEFGGAASPDNLIEITIPPESGLIPVVPGLILTNSLAVTAFADSANVVMVGGFINRIT